MVRRNLSAFVIGLVAIVVLAGGAGPAVLAKTKVRFMMWGPPDPYEPVIAAFEKAHPDIDVVPEPGPDFGPYLTRLQAQFAAGLAPDVFKVSGAFLATWPGRGPFWTCSPTLSDRR
ncbi:MAG TPA: extracellular solute-binding protein [Firmicutes bacterium]|nr:extracellular solute-binding protein [Bacillota bacterium]